jgi:hypothetical protein
MRRTILLSLFALLAVSAANDACAQRRGGAGPGFARGGYGFSRGRAVSPYGFGIRPTYPTTPATRTATRPSRPFLFSSHPCSFSRLRRPSSSPVHPVVTEYKWPAAGAASSPSAHRQPPSPSHRSLVIVLKDGSTLSAVAVFASDDGLHYVDPDERHLRISMSEVDRAATLKLNRARNLNLYLPAAQ